MDGFIHSATAERKRLKDLDFESRCVTGSRTCPHVLDALASKVLECWFEYVIAPRWLNPLKSTPVVFKFVLAQFVHTYTIQSMRPCEGLLNRSTRQQRLVKTKGTRDLLRAQGIWVFWAFEQVYGNEQAVFSA